MAAGDEIYVPLARYSEASDPKISDYHDSVIEVCMPENTAFLQVPLLQAKIKSTLTIRVTGVETPFSEIKCDLWTDAGGVLRIKSSGSHSAQEPNEISLFEAATRAYEQTQNSPISIISEGLTNSPDDLLIWYCNAMARHQDGKKPLITLWGIRPPSRVKEEIYIAALSRYDFIIENGSVVFQERNGGIRYVNLTANEHEVTDAIKDLAIRVL